MEWIAAIALFVGCLALLPTLLRRNRKAQRSSKGTAGGVMMAFGLAFMTIFDPGKAESVEEIRRRNEVGEEEDESGAPPR